MANLYATLKDWVLKNGTVRGDYVFYWQTADTYGGYSEEDFSLYYWAGTEKLEFSLHSVLDDEYSINFYLYIPKKPTGNYEYVTSYYYRDSGVSVCESRGTITAATFTKNYPLNSQEYIGAPEDQTVFLEESRIGICDALDCLKQFLAKEKIGYTLVDLGFTKF